MSKQVRVKDAAEISDELKAILDERLAAHKANPEQGRSWKEVRASISSKK